MIYYRTSFRGRTADSDNVSSISEIRRCFLLLLWL
jgi:hypothetical protein